MSDESTASAAIKAELSRLQQENALLKAQLLVREQLGPTDDHIFVVDWDGQIHHCVQSKKPQSMALNPQRFEKTNLFEHIAPEFHEDLHAALLELALGVKAKLVEYALVSADNQAWYEAQLVAFEVDGLKLVAIISQDITRRMRLKISLTRNAWHDAITQLPNKLLFEQRVQDALVQAKNMGGYLCLLIVDIEKLRHINDQYGHHVGDALLKQMAIRLQNSVRRSDFIARIGGDEFAVLMPGLGDGPALNRVVTKLVTELSTPITLGGDQIPIQVSIGSAVYPNDATSCHSLLEVAISVLQQVKFAHAPIPSWPKLEA